MCAWFADGSYDCDEQWVIYVYDQLHPLGCTATAGGCANYYSDVEKNKLINPSIHIGNSTDLDDLGNNVLYHELKHLQCLCNYHDDPPEAPRR